MHIWVDADACPAVIREILYRAVKRTGLALTLVANSPVRQPPLPGVRSLQVPQGADMADQAILERLQPGDLVITADIPLAAEVIAGGATALNPRGEQYTPANIRERLNLRDFMETMRASGAVSGGPPPLGLRERQAFGNALDRLITAFLSANGAVRQ